MLALWFKDLNFPYLLCKQTKLLLILKRKIFGGPTMHFPHMTEIGERYYEKEVGTEGHRRKFLDGCATDLQDLKIRLAAARVRASAVRVAPAGASVKERAAFFEAGAAQPQNRHPGAGETQKAAARALVGVLEGKIESLTQKLVRQGAVILANGTIDWIQTTAKVYYDTTAAQQGLTRLHFQRGLIFTDAACTTPFDTIGKVTAAAGIGWAIYVVSAEGNIHAASHSVGKYHHSSLLAGANVAGAGELRVLAGKLVEISNKSGHYTPAASHLIQVLYLLKKRGVDLHSTKVKLHSNLGIQNFPSVAAFMTALPAMGFEPDFELTKLLALLTQLPYDQFAAAAAAVGWRWVDDPERARGLRGVVQIADGAPVPHRDARKWLKSIGQTIIPSVKTGVGR